jgi:hypothetical protein
MFIVAIMEAIPQLTESLARRARSHQIDLSKSTAIGPYSLSSLLA